MKKSFSLLAILVCMITSIYGQSPFKYQAVVRDTSGLLLPNKNMGIRISIMQGLDPVMVYSEEYNKTSDQFGIINIEVGTGKVLNGNYLTINWAAENNQLQIEIDLAGGTTYTLLGTSPILSVPVANYAVKAGSSTFPAGLIMPFAGNTDKIPDGWLLCNGDTVSREKYPELFEAISVNWGGGNLSTTFNLPDLRGQFLRGVDGEAGVDPDKLTRTEKFIGGNSGNNVGSYQSDLFKTHNHTGNTNYSGTLYMSGNTSTDGSHAHTRNGNYGSGIGGSNNGDYVPYNSDGGATIYSVNSNGSHSHSVSLSGANHYHSLTTYETGGPETRTKNAYVLYIIKY